MNLADMGHVFQFLLKYRMVESKPMNRKSKNGEQQIASILNSYEYDDFENFNAFLMPQGFILKIYDDTTMTGIYIGQKAWILARNPEAQVSKYLSVNKVKEHISIKDNESRETCNIWFLHIWLVYLYITYTMIGRGVSQVSLYGDAFFFEDQLTEAVNEHIEVIRQTGIEKGAEEKVFNVLCDSKGTDVVRRVKGFITIMSISRLIAPHKEEGEFCQTLLGAVELSEGYSRSMTHYLNLKDNTLDNIVNTMAPPENDNESIHNNSEDQNNVIN